MNPFWWKEAVVYQIYPRSFKDSNGDGIGDIPGITSKLDYLKDLGVDVIWLSPHFKSPNVDNGYDISDYRAVMEDFGTMADFEHMLAETHKRDLKLIIDLVVNHSSNQHEWFREASKSKENPYRNYYIWKDQIPNDWISFFSGNAWEIDEASKQFYLHLFAKEQPDLNWENPALRHEVYDIMHFWLKKGVDGFRMDVISVISKDQAFPDFPEGRFGDLSFYANGPKVHEYLKEMNREVLSKYDCMTVGEAFGVSATGALDYTGQNQQELNMIYHFDHAVPRDEICFVEPKAEFTLIELKKIFDTWDKTLANDGWNTIYFGNHDNPRMISRFGDLAQFRNESAKMLATVLLTLRGTPYLYQGDEIGMSNALFNDISEYNDLQVINAYQALIKSEKYPAEAFYESANRIARDHARTPMQWSAQQHAGFTEAQKPWLKINENHSSVNVASQMVDTTSILNYYKELLKFRKANITLVYGDYIDLKPTSNLIWMYERNFEDNHFLILINFTNQLQTLSIEPKYINARLKKGNYIDTQAVLENTIHLKPYESNIYQYYVNK